MEEPKEDKLMRQLRNVMRKLSKIDNKRHYTVVDYDPITDTIRIDHQSPWESDDILVSEVINSLDKNN